MSSDAESLERIVPDELRDRPGTLGRETLELHEARYGFAVGYLRPGHFLDMACGVGYGTRMLLEQGPRPLEGVGVDRDGDAVAYARARYGTDGIAFVASDALAFHDARGFDAIVSLETIEHVPDPRAFVEHVAGMLRTDGVLVASAPTTPSRDGNPHHLSDFTPRSFRKLFHGLSLREVDALVQVQRYRLDDVRGRSGRSGNVRRSLVGYYARNPASLVKRVWALAGRGLVNEYTTVVMRRV